ncbi:MAG: DUF4382 domain-containing protein [Candidatus Hydrogenedentes bacterium]|nr:DUF4382 domain-containing protein [Candidatus Hydrogenedentota bacterium]
MFRLRESIPAAVLAIFLAAVVLTAAGCPASPPEKTDSKVSVVFGSNVDPAKKAASDAQSLQEKCEEVPDVYSSLTVTVTDLSVDYAGVDPPSGGEVENIPLLSEPVEVDIFHLDETGLSKVLNSVELPAGYYTALHVSFENPRLLVQLAGQDILFDLQITAQGSLTINTTFQLPENDCVLLVDFGGIHLSLDGQGALILTPNITVEILESGTSIEAEGTIKSVNTDNQTLVLDIGLVNAKVDYSAAGIYLPTDTYTPSGTEADLVTGAEVTVAGVIGSDGVIQANTITISSS